MATDQARFNIPKQELPHFRVLVQTDPETLQRITEALAVQPPALNIDKLSPSISEASGIEQSVVDELLPLVWRWTMVQRRLDLNAADFVACLEVALDALSMDEWSANDRAGWAKVSSELRTLLSSDTAITSSAKAAELLLDQQLVLCSSRVITDMRTVFDDAAETIKGILPYHTLVLRCHQGSDIKKIYIGLDLDDLVLLRKQIERAEQKEKLLRNSLENAGIAVIETSVENVD